MHQLLSAPLPQLTQTLMLPLFPMLLPLLLPTLPIVKLL
jgi:hypothetical protein